MKTDKELIGCEDKCQELAESVVAARKQIEITYASRLSNRSYDPCAKPSVFQNQQNERFFLRLMDRYSMFPVAEKKILDVGTAGGYFLRSLLKYGIPSSHLIGIDFWETKLRQGHAIAPCIPLICAAGEMLPFPDAFFDLVVQRTVFSSILDDKSRLRVAQEMLRVVKSSGIILSWDFRVKRPGDDGVRAMTAAELRSLFPGAEIAFFSDGLPPQLVRVLAPVSFLVCQFFSTFWPRPVRCYYWTVIRKVSSDRCFGKNIG